MRIIPSFTFSGFDADLCPDMEGTVWLEPPSACSTDPSCPAEGITIPISTAEIVNGAWTSTQTTGKVSGEWFAHVTITPIGFNCALAMVDTCTAIDVVMPCEAAVSGFSGDASINTQNGQLPTYVGPAGLNHALNWSVSDLWNCNLCASYSVADSMGGSTSSANMSKSSLISFSGATDNRVSLVSNTSYYPLEYTLVLSDCDSKDVYSTKTAIDANPHPACTVSCSVDITDVQPNADNTSIDISQTWTELNSYTCGIAVLGGDIDNGAAENTAVALTTVTAASANASPATWEALVWDNFPMTITASAVIHSDYLNADLCTATDSFNFQPACEFAIASHTMSASIVEGAAWGDHKIMFTDKVNASVGPYCPVMSGTRALSNNGEAMYSQATPSAGNASFLNAGGADSEMTQSVDFTDGSWCSQYTLAGTDNTVSSTSVCHTIDAPPCVITTTTAFDGALDTSDYMMTYTTSAAFTANAWCNPASMVYSWTSAFEEGEPLDWSPRTDYQSQLVAGSSASYVYSAHESDYEICNNFGVTFTPVDFNSQDMVTESANACYTHEQTCRPRFAADPNIIDTGFIVSDTDITVNFNLEFNTAGYQNCGEMQALVQIYIDDPEVLVYSYTMDSAAVAEYQNVAGIVAAAGIKLDGGCYRVKVSLG
jgi:hypothetical protein